MPLNIKRVPGGVVLYRDVPCVPIRYTTGPLVGWMDVWMDKHILYHSPVWLGPWEYIVSV